jgi:hypothetical protein
MVPGSDSRRNDDADDRRPALESDGGVAPGVDDAALFRLVRDAVKDALLDVIGTLLLLGVAGILVVAGGQLFLSSVSQLGAVVGGVLVVVGLYLAAATLEIIPPVRDWL